VTGTVRGTIQTIGDMGAILRAAEMKAAGPSR